MAQGKWIVISAVAIIVLAGIYFFSKLNPPADRGDDPRSPRVEERVVAKPAITTGADGGEPHLAPGTAMPPLSGRWLTVENDGKVPVLAGRVVLLDFWGIFCRPCLEAIPATNKVAEKYGATGLVVAGVSLDSRASLIDFKKSREIRYALLASDQKTFEAYRIEATPSLFLFDKSGKLIWRGNWVDDPKSGTIDATFEKLLLQALAEK